MRMAKTRAWESCRPVTPILHMSEMQKKLRVTDFVFEIKRVKNYPKFDKSVLVTRHGLNGC